MVKIDYLVIGGSKYQFDIIRFLGATGSVLVVDTYFFDGFICEDGIFFAKVEFENIDYFKKLIFDNPKMSICFDQSEAALRLYFKILARDRWSQMYRDDLASYVDKSNWHRNALRTFFPDRLCIDGIACIFPDRKFVIKPSIGSGSIGVEFVGRGDIIGTDNFSGVIEEFVKGVEYSIECFVVSGTPLILGVGVRHMLQFSPQSAKCICYSEPESMFSRSLERFVSQFVRDAGIRFSPLHLEVMHLGGTKFKILDFAIRGGGNYISSRVISLHSGFDHLGALATLFEGRLDDLRNYQKPKKFDPVTLWYFACDRAFRLGDSNNLKKVLLSKGVIDVFFSRAAENGDVVEFCKDDSVRFGCAIFDPRVVDGSEIDSSISGFLDFDLHRNHH